MRQWLPVLMVGEKDGTVAESRIEFGESKHNRVVVQRLDTHHQSQGVAAQRVSSRGANQAQDITDQDAGIVMQVLKIRGINLRRDSFTIVKPAQLIARSLFSSGRVSAPRQPIRCITYSN